MEKLVRIAQQYLQPPPRKLCLFLREKPKRLTTCKGVA
jgi:hypothetical protein